MNQKLLALAALTTCLSFASPSQATIPPSCIGAWAAARPGPIMPFQKAIRVIPNPIVKTEADFSARLLDASAQEIQVLREAVGNGTYFLVAAQELAVGSYLLEYTDACESTAQKIDLAIVPTPALPQSIGTLTIKYETYCPGEMFDSPWGPLTKDYPPPFYFTFELAQELHAFGPFIRLHVERDWQQTSGKGGFPFYYDRFEIAYSQATACGVSPSVPTGHRIVTVTGEIIDGPTLPSVSAEADVTCLDCPFPVPIEPRSTPVRGNGIDETPAIGRQSCSFGQTSAGSAFAAALGLVAFGVFRRRARCGDKSRRSGGQ